MGQSRYYLVRRESREFIGPMSISDFKRRLERMEFGMQDEVSGHCGPWTVLDHRDEISKHYPEILTAVGESLPMSWRETTGHARVISRQDSRKDRKRDQKSRGTSGHARDGFDDYLRQRQKKSQRIKLGSLVLVLSAAMFAGYNTLRKEDLPPLAELTSLAGKNDPTDFLNVMGVKVIPSLPKIMRTQKIQNSWLPLLRMYSFYTTGSVEGVSAKLIRGDLPPSAPQDCSVEGWKGRWRESSGQVVQFVQGKAMPKNPWTKILALDPHWVRRRPTKGWLKPRNYYEGCLMTAQVAIRSIASDPSTPPESQEGVNSELLASVGRRLQNQLELIATGRVNTPFEKTNSLGAMTCFESWSSLSELDACRSLVTEGVMKPLMDEKYSMGLLRAALSQGQGGVDPKLGAVLQATASKLSTEDLMSHLDLGPEQKLFSYCSSGNAIEVALSKVDQEYPEVRFR